MIIPPAQLQDLAERIAAELTPVITDLVLSQLNRPEPAAMPAPLAALADPTPAAPRRRRVK